MSDTSTTPETPAPARAPANERLRPPRARAKPWLSIAVAGIAGAIVLEGAAALGSEYSENWASITVGIAVVAAYLLEYIAGRVVQAACTTIVAFGIPTFVTLAVTPIHTYNGFRMIVLLSIALWVAVFMVGGTRGRALFLALAMLGAWTFAVLEVGHVQDTARVLQSIVPFATPTYDFDQPDCEFYEYDDEGNFVENQDCAAQYEAASRRPPLPDYSLGIGLVSLLFAMMFLAGMVTNDGRNANGLGTAFAIPALIAITTAVGAFALKLDSIWFGGVLAMIGGLILGSIGNGNRRFTTWAGALGVGAGILLFTGDVAEKWFDSDSDLVLGLTWIVAGVVAIVAAVKMASPHDDDYETATDS